MIEWIEDAAEEEGPRAWKALDGSGLCWLALAVGDPDDPAPEGHSDFVSSTGNEDRYGDFVEQREWRLANYRRNPVILLEHGHGPQGRLVIGRSVRVGIVKNGDKHELRQRIQWDKGEHNPIATLVAQQHATGFRNAVSVGFRPKETISRTRLDPTDPRFVDPNKVSAWRAGYVHRFPELYETSSVAVPGNAEALGLSAPNSTEDTSDEALKRAINELLPAASRDALLSFIRKDPEVRRALALATFATNPAADPPADSNKASGLRWVRSS